MEVRGRRRESSARIGILTALSLLFLLVVPPGLAMGAPGQAHEIAGTVMTADHVPAAGVTISASSRPDGAETPRTSAQTTTEENGEYRILLPPGRIHLVIDDLDYRRTTVKFDLAGDRGVDIPVRPAPAPIARVSGVIRSGLDAEPAAGQVEVLDRPTAPTRGDHDPEVVHEGNATYRYEPPRDLPRQATTDAEGAWSMLLPAGDARLQLTTVAGEDATVNLTLSEGEERHMEHWLGERRAPSSHLTGTVLSERDGQPIGNAEVIALSLRWPERVSASTAPDGSFNLSIAPGPLVLAIQPPEVCDPRPGSPGPGSETCPTTAHLPAVREFPGTPNHTLRMEVELPPTEDPQVAKSEAMSVFTGWVVDRNSGEPLPNSTVWLHQLSSGAWGRATAGDDGSFRIQIPEGHYTLFVEASGHVTTAHRLPVYDRTEDPIMFRLLDTEQGTPTCCRPVELVLEELTSGFPWPEDPPSYLGGPGDLGHPGDSASQSGEDGRGTPFVAGPLTGLFVLACAALFRRGTT